MKVQQIAESIIPPSVRLLMVSSLVVVLNSPVITGQVLQRRQMPHAADVVSDVSGLVDHVAVSSLGVWGKHYWVKMVAGLRFFEGFDHRHGRIPLGTLAPVSRPVPPATPLLNAQNHHQSSHHKAHQGEGSDYCDGVLHVDDSVNEG